MASGELLPRFIAVVEVEVEVEKLFAGHVAGAGVAEAELFEEAEGGFAIDEGVEDDFDVAAIVAELHGGFEKFGADAPAADVLADAEAADFAGGGISRAGDRVIGTLYADHAEYGASGKGVLHVEGVDGFECFGDPKVRAGVVEVGDFDVVDVEAGVVFREMASE